MGCVHCMCVCACMRVCWCLWSCVCPLTVLFKHRLNLVLDLLMDQRMNEGVLLLQTRREEDREEERTGEGRGRGGGREGQVDEYRYHCATILEGTADVSAAPLTSCKS